MTEERPPWVCEDCSELATGDMCEKCGNIPPVMATGAPAPQLTPVHVFPGMALGGPKWARIAFVVILVIGVAACILLPFFTF